MSSKEERLRHNYKCLRLDNKWKQNKLLKWKKPTQLKNQNQKKLWFNRNPKLKLMLNRRKPRRNKKPKMRRKRHRKHKKLKIKQKLKRKPP
jgi:hypothetical protein